MDPRIATGTVALIGLVISPLDTGFGLQTQNRIARVQARTSVQFNAYPALIGCADVAQQMDRAIPVDDHQILRAIVVEVTRGQSPAGGLQQRDCSSLGVNRGKTTTAQSSAEGVGLCEGIGG